MAADPELLALYPEPDDLAPARHRLTLFLAQYWGGPTTYSDERGHPRLRARHLPFTIGDAERDRWLRHMRAAVAAMDPPPEIAEALLSYFTPAADAMRNTGLYHHGARRHGSRRRRQLSRLPERPHGGDQPDEAP